ncbi:hypothetical protein V2J09_018038 [Rumex salicifolius]
MHGPCGERNSSCACMKEKNAGNDSYPIYRRRNNGDCVKVRGAYLDNRWVIPYNPFLLVEFDCHLNVDICSNVKAVKYIYKYVYKGHDKICFDIEKNHLQIENEPKAFQSARWVSPPKACYGVFGFDLYDMQPPVIPLQVHLPDMQFVPFTGSQNIE